MKKIFENLRFYFCPAIWIIIVIFLSFMFMSCASQIKDGPPNFGVNIDKIPNVKIKLLTRSKYGNPSSYTINRKYYCVLKTARGYEQRGIASWYGIKFMVN